MLAMYESDIKVLSLGQFALGSDSQISLAHDRPYHLLVWMTRGQGRVLLDGQRRGLGAHNAIFVPAGHLFALKVGRQCLGHVVTIPVGTPLRLPEIPRHLRILDVQAQNELNGLIEHAAREQLADSALRHDALEAHAALISVWLRRQMMLDEHVPPKPSAAARLSARFCAQVSAQYNSGAPMAAYAKQLNVTPTHLSRAVKAATGRTAAGLLSERTLFAARHMLVSTPHPVQAIAQHLGFGSAAYFTRFIQQNTGLSPSKLRTQGKTAPK